MPFYFYIENLGTVATLPNAAAYFNTDDPYVISLSSNVKIFGEIEPGASVSCTSPLTINLSSECPDEYHIPIQYRIYSNGTLYWEGVYLIPVGDPDAVIEQSLPESYVLKQNYPNPFNPSTRIEYSIPEATVFRLTIFDSQGREVRELFQGTRDPGAYEIQWDGLDASGNPVGAGIYVARLDAGPVSRSIKMVFLKIRHHSGRSHAASLSRSPRSPGGFFYPLLENILIYSLPLLVLRSRLSFF